MLDAGRMGTTEHRKEARNAQGNGKGRLLEIGEHFDQSGEEILWIGEIASNNGSECTTCNMEKRRLPRHGKTDKGQTRRYGKHIGRADLRKHRLADAQVPIRNAPQKANGNRDVEVGAETEEHHEHSVDYASQTTSNGYGE